MASDARHESAAGLPRDRTEHGHVHHRECGIVARASLCRGGATGFPAIDGRGPATICLGLGCQLAGLAGAKSNAGEYRVVRAAAHVCSHGEGARRTNLMRLVLGQAMAVVLLGAALGLLSAVALTRFMSALLAEVSPLDPLTLVGVTAFLLSIAVLAATLPALRATRTDPLAALNAD